MNMSLKIAESDCDVAMVHYHGEHWLMPYFYYAKKAMGVVYLNVTAPLRGSRALPFQELPLDALLVDKALRLAPVCRWEGASLKEVRMFVAPSRYLLRNAEKQGMTGEKRGEVVPLGVNHSVFFPTGEEEPFALYVGRIHPHKSLELAIMAMAGTSTDESLVIAGDVSDGYQWYLQKLVQLAEKMKVADRVKIVKSPSDVDVVRLMQTCSVFLFPSTIDTFGLVVLEAMACGKPVIACNRGGVPEVIGNAGFLLEPNTQQWQKTVGRVLSDSQTRREMGEKAFERSESFSWENTTDRLICSFEHLND
jgi:glycosyltransferase involved in cell wall biosynthesis